MKKKTVITTERHEVWVVREAVPEPAENQTIDVDNAIEVPSSEDGPAESDNLEGGKSNDD